MTLIEMMKVAHSVDECCDPTIERGIYNRLEELFPQFTLDELWTNYWPEPSTVTFVVIEKATGSYLTSEDVPNYT